MEACESPVEMIGVARPTQARVPPTLPVPLCMHVPPARCVYPHPHALARVIPPLSSTPRISGPQGISRPGVSLPPAPRPAPPPAPLLVRLCAPPYPLGAHLSAPAPPRRRRSKVAPGAPSPPR